MDDINEIHTKKKRRRKKNYPKIYRGKDKGHRRKKLDVADTVKNDASTLQDHPDTTHVDVHALSSGDNIEVPLVSNVFRNAVRADGFDRRDSMPFPELLKKDLNLLKS